MLSCRDDAVVVAIILPSHWIPCKPESGTTAVWMFADEISRFREKGSAGLICLPPCVSSCLVWTWAGGDCRCFLSATPTTLAYNVGNRVVTVMQFTTLQKGATLKITNAGLPKTSDCSTRQ